MPPIVITIDEEALRAAFQAARVAAPATQPAAAAQPARVSSHLSKRFYDLLGDQQRECSICWDQIRHVGAFDLLLCGHFFHRDCIERADRICALCRVPG